VGGAEFSLDHRLVVDLVAGAYITLEIIFLGSPVSMARITHVVSLCGSNLWASSTTLCSMATPII
jgi:hypothetical protein